MRCSNCGADVNPLREYCPSCGASAHSRLSGAPRRSPDPSGRPPEELQRNRKTVLAVVGGILVLTVAFGSFRPFGHRLNFGPGHVTIDTGNTPRGPVTIDAEQFYQAYQRDPSAADDRFRNREMVVTGEFVRTVPDGYGSIDMRFRTSNPEAPLGVDLDRVSVDGATKLEPGQQVTVSCRGVGRTGEEHWLRDCIIQPPAETPAKPGAGPPAVAPPAPPPPPNEPTLTNR